MRTYLLAVLCCIGFLTGCVQYDYVGQKFPANENGAISFYDKESDVPRDQLLLIGRMRIVYDTVPKIYDVKDDLLAKARAYGADAVSIVSQQKILENTVDEPVLATEFPNSNINPMGVDMYGDPYVVNSFGQEITTEQVKNYDWVVKALFWKNRKTAEAELAKRRGELKDNVIRVVKRPAQEVKAPVAEKPASPQK